MFHVWVAEDAPLRSIRTLKCMVCYDTLHTIASNDRCNLAAEVNVDGFCLEVGTVSYRPLPSAI